MAVEVASGAVVVLGGSWIGVASEDLGVPQRHSGVEGVRDGGVPQRVRADVPRDAGGLRDPQHHPVDVTAIDRLPGGWPYNQRAIGASTAAGHQDPEDRDGEGQGGGLAAVADQVEDAVPAQGFGVVLDPHHGGFGGAMRVDAEQIRQGAVVDGQCLGDLEEPDESSRSSPWVRVSSAWIFGSRA